MWWGYGRRSSEEVMRRNQPSEDLGGEFSRHGKSRCKVPKAGSRMGQPRNRETQQAQKRREWPRLVFKVATTGWGLHKSPTVFSSLNTKPHSFTSNMTTPPTSLHPPSCPISGIWHKIMIQQMPAGWMNPWVAQLSSACWEWNGQFCSRLSEVTPPRSSPQPPTPRSGGHHSPDTHPPRFRTPSSKVSETLSQGLLGWELSLFLRNMTGKLWLFRPVQVRKPEGSRNVFPLTLLIQIQRGVCYYVKVQIHMFISKVSAILAFLYILIFNQCLRYQQP